MKIILTLACLALLMAPRIPAAAPGPKSSAGVCYIFGADTSFSMARQKHAVAQAVAQLIGTGLSGQMRDGEVFALWTFNERVFPNRFTPQVWTSEQAPALAEGARKFLAGQWCEKQTRIDSLIAELRRAGAAAETLVVLLFSDGDTPLQGTPFDSEINQLYRRYGRELRRLKQPFVTTLVFRNGDLSAWAVHRGIEGFQLPQLPASATPAPIATGAPTTAPPMSSNPVLGALHSAAPATQPSSVTSADRIAANPAFTLETNSPNTAVSASTARATRETMDEPPAQALKTGGGADRASPGSTSPSSAAPAPAATESISAPAVTKETHPLGSATAAEIAPKEMPSTATAGGRTARNDADQSPPLRGTPPSAVPAATPARSSEPQRGIVSARPAAEPPTEAGPIASSVTMPPAAMASNVTASNALAVAVPATDRSPGYLLLAAGLLVLALVSLTWWTRSTRRPQPSLISRSLDRDRPE